MRAIKWAKAPFLYIAEKILFEKVTRKSFCVLFKIINNIGYKFPVSISYESKNDLYSVKDKYNQIWIGNRVRIKIYHAGIMFRLKSLANTYLVDSVNFSADDIVIDVGANIGEFSYYMANEFGVKVISIEPEELEYRALVLNTKNLNVLAINKGLWYEEKELTLYQKNDTGDSSLIKPPNYESTKTIKTTTLNKIIKTHIDLSKRIKFVKLEAEGAEPEIIIGASKVLSRIDYISADVGPERGIKQENTMIEVLKLLMKNGFEPIKFGNNRNVLLFKNMSH